MKQFLSLIGLLLSSLLYAQAPQFIHYQAVLRDANGAVLSNQTITLKLEITQGQNTYTEIRTVTTNNVGLVNLNIGSLPAPNSIPFTDIDWASGNTSFITWFDPTNTQNNWQYIGNSSIASVPYALHAANVFSGDFNDLTNIPNIDSSNVNEIQSISAVGDTIFLSNGGYIYFDRFSGNFSDLTGVPTFDSSNSNEIQFLSQTGDTIALSNGGGSIYIPSFSGDYNDLFNKPQIDSSNTNEIQVLSLSGDTLKLSNGGYVVIPVDKWSELNGNIYRNSKVGINTTSPTSQLDVVSPLGTPDTELGLTISRNVSNNGWGTPLRFNALNNLNQVQRYGQITGGILSSSGKTGFLSFSVANGLTWGVNYEQEKMRLNSTGLGIGTSTPLRSLHVNGSLRLSPLSLPPSAGAAGDIYVDQSGALNFYSGGKWVKANQQLSFSSDTLTLSDGGFVVLPFFSGDYNDLINKPNGTSNNLQVIDDLGDASTNSTSLGLGNNILNGVENTAVGINSLLYNSQGSANTGVGYDALKLNTSGARNTAVGMSAALQNIGYQNVAVGYYSLLMSQGSFNTAIGSNSLVNHISGTENVALGYKALELAENLSASTAIGSSALRQNKTGLRNSALGYNALVANDSGNANSAFGYNVMAYNIGGDNNSAFGDEALGYNRQGNNNSAFGARAMFQISSQIAVSNNSAFGAQALFGTAGSNNSAFGFQALKFNGYGEYNTSIGTRSLFNSSGDSLTAVGANSLFTNQTGKLNTGIGAFSDVSSPNLTNATAIGALALVDESNSIQLGNTELEKVKTKGVYYGSGAVFSDSTGAGGNSILRLSSNTKGFIPPRMTSIEMNAINGESGMIVFCTDCNGVGSLMTYNNGWIAITGGSSNAGAQTLSINGDTLSLSNGGFVVLNYFSGDYNDLVNQPNIDTSISNEIQSLSINGDTLFISNGGYVILPSNNSSNGQLPSITLDSVNSSYNSITVHYSITNSGSSLIQSHGLIYSDSSSPTFDNSQHILFAFGKKGHYSQTIGGIQANKTLYIKACASNSSGTSMTSLITETTANYTLPSISQPNNVFFTNDSVVSHTTMISDCGNDPNCNIYWVLKPMNYSGLPTFNDSASITVHYNELVNNWNVNHNSWYKYRLYIENSLGSSYSTTLYDSLFIPYLVGDYALGGIVAYLKVPTDNGYDPNTYHGIIIDTADFYPTSYSCSLAPSLDSNAFQGIANGNVVFQNCGNDPSFANSAFGLTYNLSLNGYSDWCLPTEDDIWRLRLNYLKLRQYFDNGWYHTSTRITNTVRVNYTKTLTPVNSNLGAKAKAIRYF